VLCYFRIFHKDVIAAGKKKMYLFSRVYHRLQNPSTILSNNVPQYFQKPLCYVEKRFHLLLDSGRLPVAWGSQRKRQHFAGIVRLLGLMGRKICMERRFSQELGKAPLSVQHSLLSYRGGSSF